MGSLSTAPRQVRSIRDLVKAAIRLLAILELGLLGMRGRFDDFSILNSGSRTAKPLTINAGPKQYLN